MLTGSGACICFVDECEFKVAVFGQRTLEKNRSGMICFKAQLCGNYARILQIQTSKPTVGTNFDIFIAVSTRPLQSFKSTFYLLSNHVCS